MATSITECIDCMLAMQKFPDKFFDLAIVDPPYGIGVSKMNMGGRKTVMPDRKKWDDAVPDKKYFDELFRVSKNQIIWGGNYFELPKNKCFIIWDKGPTMYGRDFAECEFAWGSFNKNAKIIRLNPVQLNRIHITEKPVRLYEWLLKNYAKPGDKILDTHLGSGSSRVAAFNLGFEFYGYEIDAEYYNAQEQRFNKGFNTTLFDLK